MSYFRFSLLLFFLLARSLNALTFLEDSLVEITKGDHQTFIKAESHVFFKCSELKKENVLDIQFSKEDGTVFLLNEEDKPLHIDGKLITNGALEILSSECVFLGEEASLEVRGLRITSEKNISHQGRIFSPSEKVCLIAKEIFLKDHSKIDTSGEGFGGDVYIGGGWHGKDPLIRNSDIVSMDRKAIIITDAKTNGKAGDVVLFSKDQMLFLGTIHVRGMDQGGNIEVSSKQKLFFDGSIDAHSDSGLDGSLLIDPETITIQAMGANIDGLGLGNDITTANELSNPLVFPGVNSIITSGAVNSLLTGGVSMTLAAVTSITVASPITATGVVTSLTFDAPTLYFNQPISLPSGGVINGTATVVNVGPAGSIQNAVDAAAPGSTVNIAPGTYVEEVYINKDLTLNGSGRDNTTILCPTLMTPLNNTFVFTINGATYHPIVLAEDANNINIQNLTVDGNSQASNFLSFRFVGIGYHNASGIIQNNRVTNVEDSFPGGGAQHGFAILGAIDLGAHVIQVMDNIVDRFQKQGITMRGNLTAVISGNTVTGEDPPSLATLNGIVIQNGAHAIIINNTVADIISATPGVDSVGIFLIDAAPNSTVTSNTISNGNIGVYSINAGNNFNIANNIIAGHSSLGVYVQDTTGLTTILSNTIDCVGSVSTANVEVLNPDTGMPIGKVFLDPPTYNVYLLSSTNQPYHFSNNTFLNCNVGLAAEGNGVLGPQVNMNSDSFTGQDYYIQLINNPNNIWPSTSSVSFDGLMSGFITFEQYLEIQSKLVGNFQDPALGIILEFIEPLPPDPPETFIGELRKDKFLNRTEYCLRATWTNSPSPNVVAYRIYFYGQLVKEVPANATHTFITELKNKSDAYRYSITAVNNMGLESDPTPIEVIR